MMYINKSKNKQKYYQKVKLQGQIRELYQIFKGELISLPHNLFQDTEEETLPISFYEVRIILIPKQRYHKKRKTTYKYSLSIYM